MFCELLPQIYKLCKKNVKLHNSSSDQQMRDLTVQLVGTYGDNAECFVETSDTLDTLGKKYEGTAHVN
jgi:hypothetical protein